MDAETGLAKPQGAGSLQGAEYTMKYYDVVATTDPTASGRKAKYTWVLKTDAKGQIKLDADHLVSGPDFYKENGKVVFPEHSRKPRLQKDISWILMYML